MVLTILRRYVKRSSRIRAPARKPFVGRALGAWEDLGRFSQGASMLSGEEREMPMMRRPFLRLWIALLVAGFFVGAAQAGEPGVPHVVVLGDPHLPGKYLAQKERVLQTVNGWGDANLVAVLGDICEDLGTAEEYAAARRFFDQLKKPAAFMAGNHDYIYADNKDVSGRRLKGTVASRTAKLDRFRSTFGLGEVFSSRRLGGSLLLFLSTDDLTTSFLSKISERQLTWLRAELTANRDVPTLVFFHGPLEGTLLNFNQNANRENFVAQPAYELKELLRKHPQVFLWVAGHLHVPATNESFRAPINLFDGRVLTVHAPDLNRERIWTTSLFLHPDKVVLKTYDHQAGQWLTDLERSHPIRRP